MDINYFICTLGQAAVQQDHGSFKNINELIDQQAEHVPNLPAVGFYAPSKNSNSFWNHQILTFEQIGQGSKVVANILANKVRVSPKQTVALVCPSSADFLFSWLALMRLGHPVLLIAPQCSPSAIAHLCKSCEASVLFYDDVYEDLAEKASSAASAVEARLQPQPLPFVGGPSVFEVIKQSPKDELGPPDIQQTDVAYLHHTSGTSTGTPKPIPQSHRAGAGVLPRLDGSQHATFTTTPLYHGGIADLFRAWTSNALIWLFPGKEVPITAANVVKCLDVAVKSTKDTATPQVKYFSSVPYVLQMIAADQQGLKHLQYMDIVGVGGAALPPEAGNDLVQKGVNLVSRFGSAECGFLMSSHRDYDSDKEWQFLRPGEGVKYLNFEKQEDGLSELVILPGWPHMAKTNREDGSFATADLFAPHQSIPDAWKYHSRADSQLTLITGKKFDPSPFESAIAAASPLLSDVFIFGNGKPYPGALVFRSQEAKNIQDEELVRAIATKVEQLNADSQSHARIPRNMLIAMPYGEGNLEKSSKGTILRGKAEERYESTIEDAYASVSFGNENVPDNELPATIQGIIESVVGTSRHGQDELKEDTDLFAYGADSVACVQIRHALSQLLPKDAAPLPLTVVEDSGTVQRLSKTIVNLRRGQQADTEEDQHELMERLVKEYSTFATTSRPTTSGPHPPSTTPDKTVLLTGPTGSLGSHILHQLLQSPQVTHIYLLIRGATPHAARERVLKALSSRHLPISLSNFDSKTTILPCKLSEPSLGLSPSTLETLRSSITTILHLAWSVNFLLPLRSFASTHLAGLANLLTLASSCANPPHFIFCSSVASVASYSRTNHHGGVPESILSSPSVSGGIGYSRSKWVAENICLSAHRDRAAKLRNHISVIRVGQLSGDMAHGVWNKSEAYPLMLGSARATGVLPDLQNERLAWLAVDRAAEAFIQCALNEHDGPEPAAEKSDDDGPAVYHVLNPEVSTTWTDLLRWLKKREDFDVVSAAEWLAKLEGLQKNEETKDHPSLRLLGFWRNAYGGQEGGDGAQEGGGEDAGYEMSATVEVMPCMKDVRAVDEEYVVKLWTWIRDNI